MNGLRISTRMQGKMKGFHTLNTSPLDNKFCLAMSLNPDNICSKCYSQKALKTYAISARKMWKRNGEILSSGILDDLPEIQKRYFRFSSHGEVLNEFHYINYVNIAKKNPGTNFTLWTKRKEIVAKLGKMGADNLTLIYSEPTLNNLKATPPKNYDKVFTVFSDDYVKANNVDINCGGKVCLECLICYDKTDIINVNEHLK